MKASTLSLTICIILSCVVSGAGCFRKSVPYTQSPPQQEVINVPPTREGANASTGGVSATVTPSLETQSLVNALPDQSVLKKFTATIATEQNNPVPMQDGTRSEFKTVTKTFTKTENNRSYAAQVSLTDTRSIPVLTAFIDSYSEYSNDSGFRKKISAQNETAWITYRMSSGEGSGFGSITMLYRNRFLIQIDGNLGVSQSELEQLLNAFHFEGLK